MVLVGVDGYSRCFDGEEPNRTSLYFSRLRLAQEGPLQSHMATDSSVEVHVSDEIVHECCTDPDVVDAA